MILDPATGLPELPEGCTWTVEPQGLQITRKLPDTDWVPDRFGDPQGARYYTSERKYVRTTTKLLGFIPWPDRVVYRRFYNRAKIEVDYRTEEQITRSNLLDHALKALDTFDLYGTYPPKKLD